MTLPELSSNLKVCVIGLGYVGLPMAITCSKIYPTIGFDTLAQRIATLKTGVDNTGEIEPGEITNDQLAYTNTIEDCNDCDIYIVTVPTPIDANNEPDLSMLITASESVGKVLKRGNVVVYESTVFPGATEDLCVPIIERYSGLTINVDYWVGYSPERVNPGDKEHRLKSVTKVTSGSNEKAGDFIDSFYKSFVQAGTHRAPSIRVAEAAKVIENIQRDLNIAFVNELAQLFDALDIDTGEVLAAAGTKWNFMRFQPGLVGGHCIGVDPYYLTHKAREIGFRPDVILAGRKINNSMPAWISQKIVHLLSERKKEPKACTALVCGITFKENCPDTRNSKAVELVSLLRAELATVDVYDPIAYEYMIDIEDDIRLTPHPKRGSYDAVILAVAHDVFKVSNVDSLLGYGTSDCVVYDIKHVLPPDKVTSRL
ncbi:MAG: nucleotide sugar dehydrogenase [Gammaproteobacteria bacterium]|nr:nucleotide sugar dehydrogenase [Gammaproteobacteria bacterium]MYF01763.1 nucleotide sugar dehydrogenase [Gammaproteobacteria bacterium]MYI77819.1 nucleotide sugar dehydrogenase [Gammaproteobacteria bacterium]